jgi:hypothetical protein
MREGSTFENQRPDSTCLQQPCDLSERTFQRQPTEGPQAPGVKLPGGRPLGSDAYRFDLAPPAPPYR